MWQFMPRNIIEKRLLTTINWVSHIDWIANSAHWRTDCTFLLCSWRPLFTPFSDTVTPCHKGNIVGIINGQQFYKFVHKLWLQFNVTSTATVVTTYPSRHVYFQDTLPATSTSCLLKGWWLCRNDDKAFHFPSWPVVVGQGWSGLVPCPLSFLLWSTG